VVAIGWLARERVRADPVVRMWTVGVVLALITAGTTVPTDRGLLLLTVGTSVLVADLLLVFRRPDAGWMRRAMGGLLIACHLVLSPLLLPVRVRSTGWIQGFVDVIYERLPRGPRATQHVVLVNSPSDLSMLYSRTIAQHRGEPFFASFQWLYAGMAPLTLERVADHAFVVSSTRPWLAAPLDRGFRAELDFAVGQRFEGTCLDAVIETVDDASRPTAVRFEYDPDCELVWLVWNDGGPAPLSVPPVGGRVELPAAVLE
jgi:hypothetical protein